MRTHDLDRRLRSLARTVAGRHARFALLSVFASGCSLTLDLDERACSQDSQCSLDGSMVCIDGGCFAAPAGGSTSGGLSASSGSSTNQTSGANTGTTLDLSITSSDAGEGTRGSTEDGNEGNEGTTEATEGTSGGDGNGTTTDDAADGSTTGTGDDTTLSCADDECGTTEEASEESTDTGASETSDEPPPLLDLIPNGDFEIDASGWARHGPGTTTTISISTEQAHGGLQSLFVTGREDEWHGILIQLHTRFQEDVYYIIRGWLLVGEEVESTEMRMTVMLTCLAEASTFTTLATIEATSLEWREIVGALYVESGCSPTEVRLYFEGATLTDPEVDYLDFYLDDVTVEAMRPEVPPE